jgi:hypothetical protein
LIHAEDFTLDWFVVAAGGGQSSGGDFELSATIGQPDADNMLGTDFFLAAGFWSIVTALDTPGAPALTISLALDKAVISWPENVSPDFLLEETSALNTIWTTVNATREVSNVLITVRLLLAPGTRFYRLHKP